MKVTIVYADRCVGVDNEFFYGIDLSGLDTTIHAVQWYGESGEIEFKEVQANGVITKAPNLRIFSLDGFEFVLPLWRAAKEAAAATQAEFIAPIPPPTAASGEIPITEI